MVQEVYVYALICWCVVIVCHLLKRYLVDELIETMAKDPKSNTEVWETVSETKKKYVVS